MLTAAALGAAAKTFAGEKIGDGLIKLASGWIGDRHQAKKVAAAMAGAMHVAAAETAAIAPAIATDFFHEDFVAATLLPEIQRLGDPERQPAVDDIAVAFIARYVSSTADRPAWFQRVYGESEDCLVVLAERFFTQAIIAFAADDLLKPQWANRKMAGIGRTVEVVRDEQRAIRDEQRVVDAETLSILRRLDADRAHAGQGSPVSDATTVAASVPPATRMAYALDRPRNWQDFERACVRLYQRELGDPHVQSYGRPGQAQHGVDLIGRRNGDPRRLVGIQCRCIDKPLRRPKILADCKAALALEAFSEIIFATTADDDTVASDAARDVERQLLADGHAVRVVVYGWESLQILIARYPDVSAVFNPSAYARDLGQAVPRGDDASLHDKLDRLLAVVDSRVMAPLSDTGTEDSANEDPALHARIDEARDLTQKYHQPAISLQRLQDLLDSCPVETRPWARYRVEANIASALLELGREDEAVQHFEAAYALRPDKADAVANLALARTIQRRYVEAIELGQRSLALDPPSKQGVAYLLQAAARSDWVGDPETLIPDGERDTVAAAMGMAEFLRRREIAGWAERTIALAEAHPESDELQRVYALAVLDLAVRTDEIIAGGQGAVTAEQIHRAAEIMLPLAERCLQLDYRHEHDLVAYVSNAGLLLRLDDRDQEAEALLTRAVTKLPDEPSMRRVLALTQITNDRPGDALKTLMPASDPESLILRAELLARDKPDEALALVKSVDIAPIEAKLTRLRWRMIGDLAVEHGRPEELPAVIAGLRQSDPDDILAALFEQRGLLSADPENESALEGLAGLAERFPDNGDAGLRYHLAETLNRTGRPDAAARLLEPIADLGRVGPLSMLYLQSLAGARLDAAFADALDRSSEALRDDPNILWSRAAHGWNIGDLPSAFVAVDKLLARSPQDVKAWLLRVDLLARSDRTADLLAELEKPVETFPWTSPKQIGKVAHLLAHFGHFDRAAAFAYRSFLENRAASAAWLALSGIILEEGRHGEQGRWSAAEVGPDAAVDLEFEGGETHFLIIEPDPSLLRLDSDSIEPDHQLAAILAGKREGDSFTDPRGRPGKIAKLRHKYIARFHQVLNEHELRFPETAGFRRLSVDTQKPGGLDELKDMLKAQTEQVGQLQANYLNGNVPLALLAQQAGVDPIEASMGVVADGQQLRVATGREPDSVKAREQILENEAKGCTLDLVSFWTAWRLKALDAVEKVGGPIQVHQSVIDRLRGRRAQFLHGVVGGLKSAGYRDGQIVLTEVPPSDVQRFVDEIDAALVWLHERAVIRPTIVDDSLPELLREMLQTDRLHIFSSMVLAAQTNSLLVCDDLFTRQYLDLAAGRPGCWLHKLFEVGFELGHVSEDDYLVWTTHLIAAGHNFIGVNGPLLARAAARDHAEGRAPGYHFTNLARMIGGAPAEPISHVRAVFGCIQALYGDPSTAPFRERALGHLLERLIHDRSDYRQLLRSLLMALRHHPFEDYFRGWVRGHFLNLTEPKPEATPPATVGNNKQSGRQVSRKERKSR